MFVALANTGLIASHAQQICQALRDNLSAAEAFYQWLAAQEDADLTSLPSPMSVADITVMRAAFADLNALYLMVYGQALPSGYGITGTYDFSTNIQEITGPN